MESYTTNLSRIQAVTEQVIEQMSQSVIGQEKNIRVLWGSLLIGGHVLLEGVPGLGKTLLVRSLSQILDTTSNRIQFTPDLMPSDVTGTKVFDLQSGRFSFRKGPIFTNVLLADEINRTPPKTQAALLEALEEKQVSVDGETFPLPPLFFVVATQNPIEYEGTYILPEAQLDRFSAKLIVDYPSEGQERELLASHQLNQRREQKLSPTITVDDVLQMRQELEQITVEPSVVQYLLQIIRATRKHPKISLGASPRAGLSVLSLSKAEAAMNGRSFVTPDDIKEMLKPALRHRIIMHPDSELEGWKADDILEEIVQTIVVPR